MSKLSELRKRLESRRVDPIPEPVPILDAVAEKVELVSVVDDAPAYVPLNEKAPTWVRMVEAVTSLTRETMQGLQFIHWSRHCDAVRTFLLEAERAFTVTRTAIPEFQGITDTDPVSKVWAAYFKRCTSIGRVTAVHKFLLTVAGTSDGELREKFKKTDAEIAIASAEGGTLKDIEARLTRKEISQ